MGYFIGSPGMNVIPARIEGSVARGCMATQCQLPGGFAPLAGKVEIGVRPEYARLSATERRAGHHPPRRRRGPPQDRAAAVLGGQDISVIAAESDSIGPDTNDAPRGFDPAGINVYLDDPRIAPSTSNPDTVTRAA